jgi:fructose-1,6-bisphosphatase/inositol monophosphatase family enzyme
MNSNETTADSILDWEEPLMELAARIRDAALGHLRGGPAPTRVDRPVSQGVGDVTYALDRATELAAEEWLQEAGRRSCLSLFSEDAGWRHVGPDDSGDLVELPGFQHGGPRVVLDPVDGTRNLMADLRSAWTVIALAGAGTEEPRLSEVELGLVAELPDSRAARFRILSARRGAGAFLEEHELSGAVHAARQPLHADNDDRVDHGYFSFFRYTPALRPMLAELEADFFQRLEAQEGADPRHCFDDQYISNGGQLVLLALGSYRFIADLRADLAPRIESSCTTSKPYDCAGAILVAREAGCILHDAEGGQVDFPLDGVTPVSFVGYANAATADRISPHLLRARQEAL